MAANTAVQAQGTLFKRGVTTLADVTAISGPGAQRDDIEVTHMESPNRAKEFMPGLADWGEVGLSLSFDPSNAAQTAFYGEFSDADTDTYSITFPDTVVWTFTGYCKGFEPGAEVGGKLTADVTVKITGDVTVT